MPSGRLTQLEAVNEVLAALGEKPVTTLVGTTSRMATLAVNGLNTSIGRIQDGEWEFNRLRSITLSVDAATGHIFVPAQIIRFDVPDEPYVIHRKDRLYDRQKMTDVFSSAITGNALVHLPWDDLPSEAKTYAVTMTAKKLYDQFVGAEEGRRNLREEMYSARARLMDYDCEMGDYSVLDDPTMPYLSGNYLVPGSPRGGHEATRHIP